MASAPDPALDRARAFFLTDVPPEMIEEIALRLDRSALRAWKRADPHVERTLRASAVPALRSAPVAIDWRKVSYKYEGYLEDPIPAATRDLIACMCSHATVDDLANVLLSWNALVSSKALVPHRNSTLAARLLSAAVAEGASVNVLRYFLVLVTVKYFDNDFFTFSFTVEAISRGRFGMLRECLRVDTYTLYKFILEYDDQRFGRWARQTRHPFVRMLQQHYYSHATWFFNRVDERWPAFKTWSEPLVYMFEGCVIFGHVVMLERYLDRWLAVKLDQRTRSLNKTTSRTPGTATVILRRLVIKILLEGDTTASLHWLEQHRPAIFVNAKGKRFHIKDGVLTAALTQCEPAKLQWLLERGYFDLGKEEHVRLVYDTARKKRYSRALAWLRAALSHAQPPLPGWFQ